MIPYQTSPREGGLDRIRIAKAFLKTRLSKRNTIDWALTLTPRQQSERTAVIELLNDNSVPKIGKPYASAWRLIVESWACRVVPTSPALAVRNIRRRIGAGDRSGVLIDQLVDVVAPRLEVKSLENTPRWPSMRARRPKSWRNLLSASLTSTSPLYDFGRHGMDFGLVEVSDVSFLNGLASALMSAVDRGLYIACRIYGDDEEGWGPMARPLRVYLVSPEIGVDDRDRSGGRVFEPDGVSRGISPAVKLLHAIVQRIVELDARAGKSFLGRWRYSEASIYQRLWAAAARDPRLIPPEDVVTFLSAIDEMDFWNIRSFPEIAELRAVRFSDFDPDSQATMIQRLRKGPPRRFWARKAEAGKISSAKRSLAALELRRIEVAGGVLPAPVRGWLREAADEFPDLNNITVDSGFRDPWVRPTFPQSEKAKSQYDELEGEARLHALNNALSGDRRPFGDPAADRAMDWFRKPEHAVAVLHDFESATTVADQFSYVWDCFGWFHSPSPLGDTKGFQQKVQDEANRVLHLMSKLADMTFETAIGGISSWLLKWSKYVVRCQSGHRVLLRAWPAAVKATNAEASRENGDDLGAHFQSTGNERVPDEVNTLYPSAGKLVRVVIETIRSSTENHPPFAEGKVARQMRDSAIGAPGYSGRVARILLTENVSTFLRVDPEWSNRYLVEPLSTNDAESVLLWRAVASNWIETDALKIMGGEALKRVLDERLGAEARESLIFRLVHDVLEAFRDERAAAVAHVSLSQMLRRADDQIRNWAAGALRSFQDDAFRVGMTPCSTGRLFRSSVQLFLDQVWPQERFLATRAVSGELSGIPAVAGAAFADAVDAIEWFVTPFDCWSLLEYGFFEGDEAETMRLPRLSDVVDDQCKATALLRLLDLTVGVEQDAVVPHDLSTALARIETEAPILLGDPAFRRLSAAARR